MKVLGQLNEFCIKERKLLSYAIIGMIITLFVISRFGLWMYYPYIDGLQSDGVHYLKVVNQFNSSEVPNFSFIGFGYPFFIWVTTLGYSSPYLLVIAQQLLTLFSLLLLFKTFGKTKYLWVVSIFCLIHIFNDNYVSWETTIFPDSLIKNLFLISFSIYFLAQTTKKRKYYVLLGILFAFLIMIRSSNIFLFGVVIAMFIIDFINKRNGMYYLLFTLGGILISYSSYNFFFSEPGKFSFLSYTRMDKYFFDNSIDRLEDISNEIIKELPENTILAKRYKPKSVEEYYNGFLVTRDSITISSLNDESIKICGLDSPENEFREHCVIIKNQWRNESLSKNDKVYIERFLHFKKNRFYNLLSVPYTINKKSTTYYARSQLLSDQFDIDSKRVEKQLHSNLFFKFYDVFSIKITNRIYRSPLLFVFFVTAIIFYLWMSIKTKLQNQFYNVILVYLTFYFGNVVIYGLIGFPLLRYTLTFEFIIPLLVLFFMSDFSNILMSLKRKYSYVE